MAQEYKSVFATLNKIDVNEHKEVKQIKDKTTGRVQCELAYLSWAWAWAEVKKAYPEATFTIYENKDGWNYHTDGRTAWVKTGVTIEGVELIEYLPVMNGNNKSIALGEITSFDVNKAIQRSLTKAAARHGLGLYIYAGEDLPEGETAQEKPKAKAIPKPAAPIYPDKIPTTEITPQPKADEPEIKNSLQDIYDQLNDRELAEYNKVLRKLMAAESVEALRSIFTQYREAVFKPLLLDACIKIKDEKGWK